MSEQGTHNHDDPHDFMRACQSVAQLNGACILEFFCCPHCDNKQTTAHAFKQELPCGACGRLLKSRVPKLPQPGEITAHMLLEAISAAKRMVPQCRPATKDWIDKQDGMVKVVAITFAGHEVHRILDEITDLARMMSGGHG